MRYFAGSQRLEKKGLSRYGLPRCDGLSSYFASRSTQKNKYSRSPVRPAHLPRHGNTSGQWQSKDSFVALECVYQVGMYFFSSRISLAAVIHLHLVSRQVKALLAFLVGNFSRPDSNVSQFVGMLPNQF